MPVSYLKMLGLTREPFENCQDSGFFNQKVVSGAYESLRNALAKNQIITFFVGESGAGKTALLSHLQENSLNDWRVEYCKLEKQSSDDEILEHLTDCFQVSVDKEMDHRMYKQQMLSALTMRFKELGMLKLAPILLLDNAEYLNFENLKLFLDINELNKDGDGKLKIVLSAQPRFLDLVRGHEFKQYRDKIDLVALNNMQSHQVGDYLQNRLEAAGLKQSFPFDEQEINTIFAQSRGNPAQINQLAHQLLLEKYSEDSTDIEEPAQVSLAADDTSQAAEEFKQSSQQSEQPEQHDLKQPGLTQPDLTQHSLITKKGIEEEMAYPGNDSKSDQDMDDIRFSSNSPIDSFDEIQNLADEIESESDFAEPNFSNADFSDSDFSEQDLPHQDFPKNEPSKEDLAQQLQKELEESEKFLSESGSIQRFLTPKFLIPGVAGLFILLSGATFFLLSDDSGQTELSQPQITSQPLALPDENITSEQINTSVGQVADASQSAIDKQTPIGAQNTVKRVEPEQEIKKIPLIYLEDDLLEVVDAEKEKNVKEPSIGNQPLLKSSPGEILTSSTPLGESEKETVVTKPLPKTGSLIPDQKPLEVDFSHNSKDTQKTIAVSEEPKPVADESKISTPAELGDNNKQIKNLPSPRIQNISPTPIIGANKRQSIAINGKNFNRETQLILNWESKGKSKEKVFSTRLTPSQFKFESSKQIRLFVNTGKEAGQWQVQAVNTGNSHSSVFDFEVVEPFQQSRTTGKAKTSESKPAEPKNTASKQFILMQPGSYYTIQLLSSSNLDAVKDLAQKHKIADKSSIFPIRRNGKLLYSLVYGSFKDKKSAAKAFKRLPKALSKNRMWARKIDEVKELVNEIPLNQAFGTVKSKTATTKNQSAPAIKRTSPENQLNNEALIASLDPQLWTFQLISLGSASDMRQYIKNNKLDNKAHFFKREVNGKTLYTLIYGTFKTRELAQQSISSLPKNVRSGKPWIRQYADVQALMK